MDSEVVRRIPVDHTCPDLFPQRVLHVWEVCVEHVLVDWTDDIVQQINIGYTITPSIPTRNVNPVTGHWFVAWLWSAVDDVGTDYEDCGGAYGPSEDGQQTNGALTLRTFPPPTGARSLTITLSPSFDGGVTHRECSFTVDLLASG